MFEFLEKTLVELTVLNILQMIVFIIIIVAALTIIGWYLFDKIFDLGIWN